MAAGRGRRRCCGRRRAWRLNCSCWPLMQCLLLRWNVGFGAATQLLLPRGSACGCCRNVCSCAGSASRVLSTACICADARCTSGLLLGSCPGAVLQRSLSHDSRCSRHAVVFALCAGVLRHLTGCPGGHCCALHTAPWWLRMARQPAAEHRIPPGWGCPRLLAGAAAAVLPAAELLVAAPAAQEQVLGLRWQRQPAPPASPQSAAAHAEPCAANPSRLSSRGSTAGSAYSRCFQSAFVGHVV